ncbi:hypothetical protein F5148DRAFT_1211002 [Russula earlei]|uniref:Uncharacterized protein n=1 Tax=Russula earlei TaxID=71964 RepID=A0ACC0U4V7_9AGAM|nr:hypothetical protein F5148DRAFT_1211002 [Russula earlei]
MCGSKEATQKNQAYAYVPLTHSAFAFAFICHESLTRHATSPPSTAACPHPQCPHLHHSPMSPNALPKSPVPHCCLRCHQMVLLLYVSASDMAHLTPPMHPFPSLLLSSLSLSTSMPPHSSTLHLPSNLSNCPTRNCICDHPPALSLSPLQPLLCIISPSCSAGDHNSIPHIVHLQSPSYV